MMTTGVLQGVSVLNACVDADVRWGLTRSGCLLICRRSVLAATADARASVVQRSDQKVI